MRISITDTDTGRTLFEGQKGAIEEHEVLDALTRELGDYQQIAELADREVAHEITAAIKRIAQHLTSGSHKDTTTGDLAYLALSVEHDNDAPLVSRWPRHYGPYLTQAQAQEITRSAPARALTLTGQMGHDVDLVRLAYIKRTQGRGMAANAERAAEEAENRADEWAARKAIAAAFTQAHAHARTRWEADHADQLAARRMSGPVLLAIRTALDMSQQALAHHLGVSRETVRDWEKGTALVPAGATDEIWQTWDAHLTALAQRMPQGITDPDTDLATLQRMLILRGPGNRLTTHPGPLTIHHAGQHQWPDRDTDRVDNPPQTA